ncbi:MAG: fused signal recognition particle receptor [Acidimicrobiaceae bacterium]|jgi:fused signal recognition particle receptor|nr:fused signal recognition particle receptor [Acidimicrobiaceae bacterium]MDQ1413655.1 fused signal recognition particle receptor [Acidimicrobiaceae bacterium]MDQ1417173.1 fused signal recognition particle receptor [Acidimicrobiaceae bacterium]
MTLVLLIALLVVVLASATAVTLTRRRRGPELEPPPLRPAPPAVPPPDAATSPTPAAPERELTPEQVAEIERALAEAEAIPEEVAEPEPEAIPEAPTRLKPSFRDRLGKARTLFSSYLGSVRSREKITDETWDDLEEALILADVGMETTTALLDDLRGKVKAESISSPDSLVDALKADLVSRLAGNRVLAFEPGALNVWLFVGVNGVGKTTTIGKLGLQAANEGRSVIMAAGDTFRAAAADQLQLWAKRVGADLVRGAEGGDPGAVVFDAKQRGAARGTDLVLADTAGRLHTKINLMEELKKVRRVAERAPGTLNEVLLVIDATTGQNGLVQAKEFAAAVGVTGVVLTKLDGTAKGGIALAIQTELGIPIKLVGLGEAPEDLIEFNAEEFVDAIFG